MNPEKREPLSVVKPIPRVAMVLILVACASVAGNLLLPASAQQPAQDHVILLPLVLRHYPWPSPFGVEVNRPLLSTLADRAQDLGTRWIRLNRISWRELQPVEGGPYNWTVLATFEDELRMIRALGMTPTVVVQHSPRWATINVPFETDCGAIRTDKFGAFASFMAALAERYGTPEFNVHHWELGNEPDLDPTQVPADHTFGCWGNTQDPYFGGEHYGNMLKVVAPAIKAVDPSAKVLIGALLLGEPDTRNSDPGKPEDFIQGILEAGAAPYIDVIPFHAYPSFTGAEIDYDNEQAGPWKDMGGWTLGKARYLRDLMSDYGVVKPLFLNEIALSCNPDYYDCTPPIDPVFFEAQANFLVRTFVRDLSEDLQGFAWYTLDGPGWRAGGLLYADETPRPSYYAYRNLATRLANSRFLQTLDEHGPAIEAYAFISPRNRVHVAWSIDTSPDDILVPKSQFVAAHDRKGALITPEPDGDYYRFTVGFSPIYLTLHR